MPVRPDLQLEKCIDDALRKNDFKPLRTLLQIDICEDTKIKCSKQFFYKLDDLICRELRKRDIQAVSIILVSVGRCGKNISILGQAGLPTMLKQGLIQKIIYMVAWFEKLKEIVLDQENSKDEAVINMVEDFFDVLMVIHDVNDEGKRQIVKSFAPRICALVIDSRVNIYIQQETLKRMNAMLDKIPEDARKILSNQEMLTLMSGMGERILDAGDYDLQVGIVEALCRMTTETQRQELACHWFTMDFIANAFKEIKDSEFETDCRRFLNLVNGMLGDKRRVFTFPCLSAFLDNYELQIPSDEKLEEFWIDFNLGSQTLSFYIAGDHDEHQWEAVTVPEEMVHLYSIEVRESKKLLTIILKNRIRISKREGKELHLYFDVSLEITNVTQKIFGADKYRDFTKKQSISIAKTSVHILFDASGSQILVPESQVSPAEELSSLKQKADSPKELPKPPQYVQNSNQEDERSSQLQMFTPSKRKMSEASMIVPGTDIYTERSPVLLINTLTPRRERVKPPLQLMTSAKQAGVSKSGEHTKQRDWHIESEATFKSVLLNETIEESLIYRKKYIVSKDVNGRLCNKNPSGKNVKSHRKSEKRLTSELNSCDVKPKKMREKSKERFSDGAESLISQINKQYTAKEDIKSTRKISESVIDNEISNRSDLQLSKEKIQKKSFRQLKTTFVNVTSECQLNDVYSFNLSGADDPVIKLGVQEFQTSARETCMDNSIITNYKKEHLFSDNETDHRCEDSMTDISWLQEPKSKPQLTDYSRSKNPKRHRPGKPRNH
ncbi:synaptonemal complex protein 2 [Rhynchocyon petersi]